MDVAIVSVIISGSVAMATVLLAPVLNLIVDTIKSHREAKAAKAEKIEKTTKELLAVVAEYQTDIHLEGKRQLETIYADILTKAYWWQYTITPFCNMDELEKIEKIRTILLDRAKVRGQESQMAVTAIMNVAQAIDQRRR